MEWEVKTIGDVAKIVGGGTPSTYNSFYWGGAIQWFTPAELTDDRKYISKSIRTITKEGLSHSSAKLLPKGTILLTTRASIGMKAILLNEAATNQGFQSLIVNSKFDNNFIYYILSPLKENMIQLASGSTFLEISSQKLSSILLPVPPLSEQRRIADALSKVDSLIESLDKLIAKKQAIKRGAMQELLTGKKRLCGFEDIWIEKTIFDIAPLQRGFDLPNGDLQRGTFPVVYSNGIGYYHKEYMCKAPGVITGRSGTIGNVTYIPKGYYWPHNTTLWVTSFKGNDPLYISYLYKSLHFEDFMTGTGVPTLNRNSIHSLHVIIPSLSEQRAIAHVLSTMDAEIDALKQKRDKIKQVKQGMMQDLLTGRIRLVDK